MRFDYITTPLPPVWPAKATARRLRPQFKTIWTTALRNLAREVRMLNGRNVEIAVDVPASKIRADGQLRADARPSSPAVIVSFDVDEARLQFPCDRFTNWQENIDAIARVMEDLRRADRYGVRAGAQYTGFKALPASTTPVMSTQQAAEAIGHRVDVNPAHILASKDTAQRAVRSALSYTHPDRIGGSTSDFQLAQEAKRILETHHGVKF